MNDDEESSTRAATMSTEDEQKRSKEQQEDEYVEHEDEDFNPDEEGSDSDNSQDEDSSVHATKHKRSEDKANDEDYDVETEKEVKRANYSKIESAEGGLIKTRHQRAVETQQAKGFKSVSSAKGSVDIEDAWAKLQAQSKERLKHRFGASSASLSQNGSDSLALVANEKIKIKRTYEYAGEVVTEEKWVERESAEAQAYLSTLTEKDKVETKSSQPQQQEPQEKRLVNDRGEKLRVVRKRPSLLEGIINGSIKPKFNTLEKSKLDFAQLVDKEGINDELVQHSKDGYLEKQDFLSRVQFHRETQIKDIRQKELQSQQK